MLNFSDPSITYKNSVCNIICFLRKYIYFIIAIVCILIIMFSYTGYQCWSTKKTLQENMATDYYTITELFADKKEDEANHRIEKFIGQNKKYIYGQLAAFYWTKYLVDHKDYQKAYTILAGVQHYIHDDNLFDLSCLRLAKLQWQLNHPKQALNILDKIKKRNDWWYQAQYIRGDILLSQKQIKLAREAYRLLLEPGTPAALRSLATTCLNDINGLSEDLT